MSENTNNNMEQEDNIFKSETTPISTPEAESEVPFGADFPQTNGAIFNNMEKPIIQKDIPSFEENDNLVDTLTGESKTDSKNNSNKEKIKKISISVLAIISIIYYGYTFISKQINKEPTKTGTGTIQVKDADSTSSGKILSGTSGTGTNSTIDTKSSKFDIKNTKLGVLYGSGFSDTGSINFAGNTLISLHDENGDIGLGFVSSFKYQDLSNDTKISGIFKNFKLMSTYPNFFDGNMTRILAMGKLYYSEKLKSGYFQIDNIISPESVSNKYKKTIETYTNHWGQYPTGSITPKKTMNLFNVLGQVIKSDNDFNGLFMPYNPSTLSGTTSSGSNIDVSSMSGEILQLNTASPLVTKLSELLDENLSKILFNAETKVLISINGNKVNLLVSFPSILYFDKNSSGNITFTLNGELTQGESLVGEAPTDSRVWGSEYIDNISNNSTFTPLENGTGGTEQITSTGITK